MSQKLPGTNPPPPGSRPPPPPSPPSTSAAVQNPRQAWEAKAFRFLRSNGGRFKIGKRELDLFLEWNSDVMAPDSEFDDAVALGMQSAGFES